MAKLVCQVCKAEGPFRLCIEGLVCQVLAQNSIARVRATRKV